MSFIFNEKAIAAVDPNRISTGTPAGFGDNVVASFNETLATELMISKPTLIEEARAERRRKIEQLTGRTFDDIMRPHVPETPLFPDSDQDLVSPEAQVVEDLRSTLPEDKAAQILTEKQLEERARELALERVAANRDVRARSQGFIGSVGQFIGAAGAFFKDPVLVSTLPFGASSGARLLVAAAVEGAIAGTETAVSQVAAQRWRKELGLPAGFEEGVKNVLFATGFGAGATVALRGVGAAVSSLSNRRLLEAHRDLYGDERMPEQFELPGTAALERQQQLVDVLAEQRAIREQLERETDVNQDTPFRDVAGAVEQHAERGWQQLDALHKTGRTTDLPAPDPQMLKDPRPALGPEPVAGTAGDVVYRFDPDDLLVDAQRFQFKSGADEDGVTEALAGIDVWHPERSEIVLVWEDAQGRRYIADGHQRRALASRIKARDPEQQPMLTGYLLRESEGVTAEDAMVRAAYKNIGIGRRYPGDSIDAAKIMRMAPEQAIGLPGTEALVRDARGLTALSDDAFGMVINDVVRADFASILGRLAPDTPELHAEVLGIVARINPTDQTQAESIIRDALSAPQVQQTTADLFGETETTQILYKERAQVMAAAARRIKQDRAAFSTLVREEARISAAGNTLVTDKNARRAQQDAEILAYLQKLARRTGPVADALARAAQDLAGGTRNAEVVGRFIDDVRRALEGERGVRGGPGGRGPRGEGGDGGRAPEAGGPVARAPEAEGEAPGGPAAGERAAGAAEEAEPVDPRRAADAEFDELDRIAAELKEIDPVGASILRAGIRRDRKKGRARPRSVEFAQRQLDETRANIARAEADPAVKANFQEAGRIADEMEKVNPGMARTMRAGIKLDQKVGKVRDLTVMRDLLRREQAKAGEAGPVTEAPLTLAEISADRPRVAKGIQEMIDEGGELGELLTRANEVMARLNREINQLGIKRAETSALPTGHRARELQGEMSGLAGTATRAASMNRRVRRGHKNANPQRAAQAMRSLREDLAQAETVLAAEGGRVRGQPEPTPAPAAPQTAGELDNAAVRSDGAFPDNIPQQLFRGTGRAEGDPGPTVTGVPILGDARYFAFERSVAERFGPEVQESRVAIEVSNPLIIRSDNDWRELTREAGWTVPNPIGQPAEQIRRQVDELQELVRARGHDGVIVHWTVTPRDIDPLTDQPIKTLRNVFDAPQLVRFGEDGPTPGERAVIDMAEVRNERRVKEIEREANRLGLEADVRAGAEDDLEQMIARLAVNPNLERALDELQVEGAIDAEVATAVRQTVEQRGQDLQELGTADLTFVESVFNIVDARVMAMTTRQASTIPEIVTPGARGLDEDVAPAREVEALPAARAADETIEDIGEVDGAAARAEADSLEADMRRQAANQDFEVEVEGVAGGTRPASEVLDELDKDRQFADLLGDCNK